MIFLFQEKASQIQPSPRGIRYLPRLNFCLCPLLDGKVNQTGGDAQEKTRKNNLVRHKFQCYTSANVVKIASL